MTEASPLQWPAGKRRCASPTRSRFEIKSIDAACKHVLREVKLLGGDDTIISTNLVLRQDGLPYSRQREPEDQGAAVYFKYDGQQMCFACDRWETMRENIYAIGKTIEAMRGIERWGSSEMMKQAFTSFVALPAQRSAWEILGIKSHPKMTEGDIEQAYKRKAMTAHPDKGGSAEAMWELNDARDRAIHLIS